MKEVFYAFRAVASSPLWLCPSHIATTLLTLRFERTGFKCASVPLCVFRHYACSLRDSLVHSRQVLHPLAKPQFDIGLALPDFDGTQAACAQTQPQQESALHQLLDDQQDAASTAYHKWLRPDECGAQFGPSDHDLQLVTGWLQKHGFQINRVSAGRSVIEFSGVESQVEQAFHTQLHKYLVNGQPHWANASDPAIPAALAPVVVGVWSLHSFRKQPNACWVSNTSLCRVQEHCRA